MGDLLSKKIPLFRVSRIQVNVHMMFILFAGIELWRGWDYPGWSILFVATLWLSVLLHEFGHCAGARYQGGDATEILLWPLGGLATCEAPQTPWCQGFVAAAGPAVNVVLAGLAWGLGHVVPMWHEGWYNAVGFTPGMAMKLIMGVNIALFTFNMLPAFPMDMGRIAQAVMWVWMGFKKSLRIACYMTFVSAAALLIYALVDHFAPSSVSDVIGPSLTIVLCIWLMQTAWNQLQMLNAGYYDDADEPWRETYRYHPMPGNEEPREKEPGFIAKWQAKREETRVKKEAEVQEQRAARLDEVLRRVAQVGMDGLSADEKSFLEQESARLREKR